MRSLWARLRPGSLWEQDYRILAESYDELHGDLRQLLDDVQAELDVTEVASDEECDERGVYLDGYLDALRFVMDKAERIPVERGHAAR